MSWRMPPEWAEHQRCWMAWPVAELTFKGTLAQARKEYADVAKAIARFEPVTMLFDPDGCDGIDMLKGTQNLTFAECPLDDSWLRDTGPTFVVDQSGALAGVDWQFDGWGKEWPYAKDAKVAARVLELAGARRIASPIVFEGGAMNVDDRGTLVTTRQCFAHRTRAGGPSVQDFENELKQRLGVSKIIWLNETLENDSTNGHVDVVAAFAPGGRIICQISQDPDDPDFDALGGNLEILRGATDASGAPLEIHTVSGPPRTYMENGERRMLSYINFYVANGGVIVPQYGFPEADQAALETIAALFPDHETIGVLTPTIADAGGNIHCITQQQPRTGASNA